MIKQIYNFTKYDIKVSILGLLLPCFLGVIIGITAKSNSSVLFFSICLGLSSFWLFYLLSKKIIISNERILYRNLFTKKIIYWKTLEQVSFKFDEFYDKTMGKQKIPYLSFTDNHLTINVYCSKKNIVAIIEYLKKYAYQKYVKFVSNNNIPEIKNLLIGTTFLGDFYKKTNNGSK